MRNRVLVVEDYDDSRAFIKFLLETYGFDVLEATNGYEAVETVRQQHPDLVIMDISMPVMDGLTATREIRAQGGERIPIVALTAQSEGVQRSAFEAGIDALLSKPLELDDLEPVLNRYLSPAAV
jgi:CheY-like chemotaxis protein